MKRFLLLPLLALSFATHADIVLRQSTASQTVQLGPFVDDTGAIAASLTISAADVRLSANGGNIVAKNSGDCTYDEVGMYACTFDATDTATVGRLQVIVAESGALPVYHEFQVAEEAVFDACCASGAAPLTADGSGFTDIPWNADWDVEVQSEATDALNAYDPPTRAELTSDIGTVTSAIADVPTNAELTSALDALAAAGVYSLGYRNAAGDECVMVISETTPKLDVTCTEVP